MAIAAIETVNRSACIRDAVSTRQWHDSLALLVGRTLPDLVDQWPKIACNLA